MANVRTILSFTDYTPTATSAQSQFPVTALKNYRKPLQPWKAAAYGSTVDVTLDFGSGNTLSGLAADPGIFLNPVNVASVRIQGNSSSSWATPPWDQPVTISKDRENGRYKGFWRLADLSASAFTYRFLNIRITAQTSVDVLPYRIGDVIVGQIIEWTINPLYGTQRKRGDVVRSVDLQGGSQEVSKLGEPIVYLNYPRSLFNATEINEQLDLLDLGLDQPFVIWDPGLGNGSQDAYLVRRIEAMPLTQTFLQFYEGQLALREVT